VAIIIWYSSLTRSAPAAWVAAPGSRPKKKKKKKKGEKSVLVVYIE